MIKKTSVGCIHPSSAFVLSKSDFKFYDPNIKKKPEAGDVVYGEVAYIGQHSSLENIYGRIHTIVDSKKSIFVFGNRYAPDYYEAVIPEEDLKEEYDLVARSGIVSHVLTKNEKIKDPTKIKILGYVCDNQGNVINTKNYQKITLNKNNKNIRSKKNRSKVILVVGTSMNSGKSTTCAACIYALSSSGNSVRSSKITGTASLKDILLMQDNGASHISDFTYLGYPSTYLCSEEELLNVFNTVDAKYGNSSENYLVIEIADGVLQRETSMLLKNKDFMKRVYKIVLCSADALGAIGGIETMYKEFGIIPNAISGICCGSPLAIRELSGLTKIPVFHNINRNPKHIMEIIG